MKANGLINDEQCVTLAMASVGIPQGLRYRRSQRA